MPGPLLADNIFIVGLIYALFAIDHLAVGQTMISRPLVVGPFIGWMTKEPVLGLGAGATIEFFWVHVIPVGIWPIDTTLITALCLYWANKAALPVGTVFAMGFVLAIPCGIMARHIDIWLRQVNNHFSNKVVQGMQAGDEKVLSRVVLVVLVGWFLKSFVLFIVIASAGQWLLQGFAEQCSPAIILAFDFASKVLLLVSLGVLFHFFASRMKKTLTGLARHE
jgi:PTS system mannose-specific IIC component